MMVNTSILEVECIICKTKHTIMVKTADYKKWSKGQAKIQEAMPYLTADERELLMSGICGRCFDKVFSEE